MSESQRWEPDDHLIPAAISGRCRMSDLQGPDRAWAVAGMTSAGLTAQAIADRLDCSLRLVKSVRSEPMTLVCARLMAETSAFENELRLLRSERSRSAAEAEEARAELERTKRQLDNLLDAHIVGAVDTCRSGHPMTDYNTYRSANGKRHCRECNRERSAAYRERKKNRHDLSHDGSPVPVSEREPAPLQRCDVVLPAPPV